MSVKDILTSLVDDGMVDTDTIGTSIYFWAFPGKARQKVSNSFPVLLRSVITSVLYYMKPSQSDMQVLSTL